jgi:hypothetical protein
VHKANLTIYEREEIKPEFRASTGDIQKVREEAREYLENRGIFPRVLLLRRISKSDRNEPVIIDDYAPWRGLAENSLGSWIEDAVNQDIEGILYRGVSSEGARRVSSIRTGEGLGLTYEQLTERVNRLILLEK